MPGILINDTNPVFEEIRATPIHPTFGAEITGIDFSEPVSDKTFAEILAAITKYGVLVFRNTALNDDSHVAFARQFGELDDIKPYLALGRKNRLKHDELFDVSNVDNDGKVLDPNSSKAQGNKGNGLFHVDSSFNPRRAGYSLLLAHELPPPGIGGHTAFADTRTAFDELPAHVKGELLDNDYIADHSIWHSRKLAAPDFFAHMDPLQYPMGRHRLIQRHEPSGRMNLYIAAHVHHIEGLYPEKSHALVTMLLEHSTQSKYVVEMEWRSPGDLMIWDNTCVMHRAVAGSYVTSHKRDMRRATVHDGSSQAWGLNEHTDKRQGLP